MSFDIMVKLYFDNFYPQMPVPASVTAKPAKTRTSLGTRIYSKNKYEVISNKSLVFGMETRKLNNNFKWYIQQKSNNPYLSSTTDQRSMPFGYLLNLLAQGCHSPLLYFLDSTRNELME